jgi:hypothetical protein
LPVRSDGGVARRLIPQNDSVRRNRSRDLLKKRKRCLGRPLKSLNHAQTGRRETSERRVAYSGSGGGGRGGDGGRPGVGAILPEIA